MAKNALKQWTSMSSFRKPAVKGTLLVHCPTVKLDTDLHLSHLQIGEILNEMYAREAWVVTTSAEQRLALSPQPKADELNFLGRNFFIESFFSYWTCNFQLLSWDGNMLPTPTLICEPCHCSQVRAPVVNHGCIGVV